MIPQSQESEQQAQLELHLSWNGMDGWAFRDNGGGREDRRRCSLFFTLETPFFIGPIPRLTIFVEAFATG